jgi:hypothetical protein
MGRVVYGINQNADNQINSINPKFLKKDIELATELFHERYPTLSAEYDLFVNKQKQLNIKHTNFELRNHLYDLEWNKYKVDE